MSIYIYTHTCARNRLKVKTAASPTTQAKSPPCQACARRPSAGLFVPWCSGSSCLGLRGLLAFGLKVFDCLSLWSSVILLLGLTGLVGQGLR